MQRWLPCPSHHDHATVVALPLPPRSCNGGSEPRLHDRGEERGWMGVGTDAVDRALGAFYGLAIGDALGMPTQMLQRTVVRDLFGEMPWFAPGPDVNEISAGLPAGKVTDDTDQAVILARTLIDGGGEIDPALLAERLLDWERAMAAA